MVFERQPVDSRFDFYPSLSRLREPYPAHRVEAHQQGPHCPARIEGGAGATSHQRYVVAGAEPRQQPDLLDALREHGGERLFGIRLRFARRMPHEAGSEVFFDGFQGFLGDVVHDSLSTGLQRRPTVHCPLYDWHALAPVGSAERRRDSPTGKPCAVWTI